ncbi:STAS domain-containing protein [Micromonospora sp. NPDC094482]|uniref:STAS domain-containing protein n=1 Tax=unclassified Micromonospora TaxID=2617518 RepID=UPI0033297A23
MSTSLTAGEEASPHPDTVIVRVTGDLDLDTCPSLLLSLLAAVGEHPTVCCDLSEVTFCCAAGVSALLTVAHEAEGCGHRFVVRGAHGVTARVLRDTGVDEFLRLGSRGRGARGGTTAG